MKKMNIETLCVQAGYNPGKGEPMQPPITQSTTFKYETSAQMGSLFDLEESGYFYSRLANPTVDRVAEQIAVLEGGVGALLLSCGQNANFLACLNICEAGDHMVSAIGLYGGTFNLFNTTFPKMGIEVTFVDQNASEEEIAAAFRPNTKLLFGETVTNPTVDVLDIEKFARVAHAHGVPLIVDNTFPTPVNCRPIEWGADIVTHSTTKYMDGHGVAIGGAIVDSGNFPWNHYAERYPGLCTPDESYHGLIYTDRFSKAAYITKINTQLMRDLGGVQSPQNAFYLHLGLQTLHLRMARHCESALKVARFLQAHPDVKWVSYPGLESDSQHEAAQKYMPKGSCGVMAFALKGGRDFAIKFMDSLRLITIETHVADCHTCVLHPASHTHRQLSDEQLRAAGVDPDLIRLSIGLEYADDILDDIQQAIDAAKK